MAREYWQSEIVRTEAGGEPVDPQRQQVADVGAIEGYWRVLAAKMKTDWPVLVQRAGDGFTVTFGNGKAKPIEDIDAFMQGTFLNLKAVRRLDFTAALERGEWPDNGKRAIPQSDEEKHDIIPTTPADQGGNMIDEETGEEVDAFWFQIKTKLAALVEKGKAIGKIDTLEKAELAAKIRDDIRSIGAMGEKTRKEEKAPHDEAAAAVQRKWVPVLNPASELAASLLGGIDAFQKAERARLEKIEREKIAKETRERLAKEAAERKIEADRIAEETRQRLETEALQNGDPKPTEAEIEAQVAAEAPAVPTADEIEAQAQQAAAEAPVEVAKPVVQGTAYSRAASKAATKKGKIVDAQAFVLALLAADDEELKAFLQKRADAAARLKFKVAGVEFIDG